MWITCVPLVWLVIVTFTAAWQKIFSPIPAIGFLAQADKLAAGPQTAVTQTLIFNARLDAVICGVLLVLVATILADSVRIWFGYPARDPSGAGARSALRAVRSCGRRSYEAIRQSDLALLRELADENAYDRHLAAHGRSHSGGGMAALLRGTPEAKYARAKCC